MLYEDELFEIYYNECDNKYISDLVNTVKNRMPNILDFFKIKRDKKIVIKLYNNVDEYKDNLEKSFKRQAIEESKKEGKEIKPREYQSWMIADTEDGNINMLSLDLVLQNPDFKNYTVKEFCFNACHEFTHLCQQQISSNSPGWFWEVLATTLGNPECQHSCNDIFTLKDLEENFDNIDGYGIAYKIGRYLFENYDNDFILSLVTDNKELYKFVESLFSENKIK